MSTESPDEERVRNLYADLIAAWNRRSAAEFGSCFAADANMIGFDGSQVNGSTAIETEIGRIFRDHQTGVYVVKIQELRFLNPEAAILRAIAGLIPHGQQDINPAINAIQSMVAVKTPGVWRIALFQNTPAQFHGRPELQEKLSAELRALIR